MGIASRLRLDLPRVVGYLRTLVEGRQASPERSSVLIVVGREDTGDLEAQVRGSRYAWDVPLISVDALFRLMRIREEVESPWTERQIYELLVPHEFTKLDRIIDLVFAATEEVRRTDGPPAPPSAGSRDDQQPPPSAFHEACAARVGEHLRLPLVRRSRTMFVSADGHTFVVCLVSREHGSDTTPNYWFGFYAHQRETLRSARRAYVALECGSAERVVLIPFNEFDGWVDGMGTTEAEGRHYWHVTVFMDGDRLVLRRRKGFPRIDVTTYLLQVPGS